MSSFLVKIQTSAPDQDGTVNNHFPGAVLSDWELNDHVKDHIKKGTPHYRRIFEPLTDREALSYREKATKLEGKRMDPETKAVVDPPFDDYIGLHPKDIIDRMTEMKPDDVEHVRQYERGGLRREQIVEYVAPSEREPFYNYDQMGIREVMEKMDVLSIDVCQEIIRYEMAHQRRPAIIEYEKEDDPVKQEIEDDLQDKNKEDAKEAA